MDIRTANNSDCGTIVDFQLRMAKETEDLGLNPETVNKGVKAVLADPGKGIYYIAETGGNVIASLLTTFEWSDWRNGNVLWIQSVYVLPEWRGKGVYKNMYSFLKDKVTNRSGIAWFKALC